MSSECMFLQSILGFKFTFSQKVALGVLRNSAFSNSCPRLRIHAGFCALAIWPDVFSDPLICQVVKNKTIITNEEHIVFKRSFRLRWVSQMQLHQHQRAQQKCYTIEDYTKLTAHLFKLQRRSGKTKLCQRGNTKDEMHNYTQLNTFHWIMKLFFVQIANTSETIFIPGLSYSQGVTQIGSKRNSQYDHHSECCVFLPRLVEDFNNINFICFTKPCQVQLC